MKRVIKSIAIIVGFGGFIYQPLNAQSCGFQTTCVPPSDWANGSWQMFYGTQRHTGRQAMRGNFTSGRYIKWTYTTGSYVFPSPAIGDINNDGQMEIVVGSNDHNIYALRGTDGTLLWSYSTGFWVHSSPAIGDINNDTQVEVVVGSDDGKVYALRGTDGSLIWSFTTGDWVISSPVIGDINNDGQMEVVVGSYDRKVYALRGTDGSLLWSYTTGDSVVSSPAIGDINNDGLIEIVVGSKDRNIYALRGTDGSILWSYYTGNAIKSSPAIGDINNDGYIEVVVGSLDRNIYALRGTNGTLLWSYYTGNAVESSPAIGDINNDGQIEVVVGKWSGVLYVLRGTDGSVVWSYNLGSEYQWSEDIVLADIDLSSPGLEIITHGLHTPTYVLSSGGTLLWQENPVGQQRSLSVGDVDSDGCVEIVAVGKTTPMIGVIDATSNEGGCGVLGYDEGLSSGENITLNPDRYVKVYSLDGKVIFEGRLQDFKAARKGVYFVKIKDKVKKIIKQ